MKKSEFYTFKGYELNETKLLTESMEDYLEMIYRINQKNEIITVTNLANNLNVKTSSVSKMLTKIKNKNLITFEKYGVVTLTPKGNMIGSYLLWRHNTLTTFFKRLNKEDFNLKQVEKIEHFIDPITLKNIEKLLEKI